MWFVDIILDLAWYSGSKGKLGEPKSRAKKSITEQGLDITFLLYGNEFEIHHLRVLIHTDDDEPPHEFLNENIHEWVTLLEVASGIAAPKTATTASLGPNTNGMITMLSRGDEHTDAPQIQFEYAKPKSVEYDDVANLFLIWKPDFRIHLFYLKSFLNNALPFEVRWLNAYRLLEWHFLQGKGLLPSNQNYKNFLDLHGHGLDQFRRPKQDRKGVIEQIRALVAHAIISPSPDPTGQNSDRNIVANSFQALEYLVTAVMCDGAEGKATFYPKSEGFNPPSPPPAQKTPPYPPGL